MIQRRQWKMLSVYAFMIMCLLYTGTQIQAQQTRLGAKTNVAYRDNYQRMSAGYGHVLEIRNGQLFASGKNTNGQLGNGTTVSDNANQVQVGTDANWVIITAGEAHSIGIKADGTLWAWGKNNKGQLGTGTTTDANTPIQIGSSLWVSVEAGANFTLAIKSDGTLWAWGENDNGQLGNGNSDYNAHPTPIQIGTENKWIQISAGEKHTLALKADGSLWAWGFGILGQIGNGSTDFTNENPIRVGADNNWKSISAGGYFSAALKANGELYTWGDNYYGQVPNSTVSGGSPTPTPTRVGTESNWTQIAAGRYHIIAAKSNGSVWAWGKNEDSELGTGSGQPTAPAQLTAITGAVQLSAGDAFSLALKSDGTIQAWGENTNGQFFIGNTTTQTVPIEISETQEVISVIAAHGFHTMVLYSNGSISGWGANSDYQLGDGTDSTRYAPVNITAAGEDNISLVTGYGHNIVLKNNGEIWGWGDNSLGSPIGSGSSDYDTVPIKIGVDNDWAVIAAGSFTSAAIKSNGTLWAWGSNYAGEVGNNDPSGDDVPYPTQIGTDNDWVSVAIGADHSLGLKADGTLWGWGSNYSGEAGGGTNTSDILSPQQVGTDNDWVSINASTSASFAIKSDGSLWGFGSSYMGQLGQGAAGLDAFTSPVLIGNDYIQAKLGNWSGVGLKANGTLYGWSNLNSVFGELGMGNKTDYPDPTAIPGQANVVQITSGQAHRGLIKSDRNGVCMTGRNWDGELGINVIIGDSSSYVCDIAPFPTPIVAPSINVFTQGNITAEITTANGTLQLESEILPATLDQTVTWSIIPVLGTASISSAGLVTALTDGTVWAKAISVTNTTLKDSLLITITNQPIAATAIEVSVLNNGSPIINTVAGTLQMVATISPSAADQNVTWSVVPVTGSASISATGLLTAQSNGMVWAKAISTQNSNLQDSLLVTILLQDMSIEENVFADLKIHPNPTNDVVNIAWGEIVGEITIDITDASGRIVFSKNNSAGNTIILDLSALNAGAYFMRVSNGTSTTTRTILKN